MNLLCLALVLSASVRDTQAAWKGFNIKSYQADGVTCKTEDDWLSDMNTIKNLPGKYGSFNAVRLYVTAECDTLIRALPAALQTNTKLLIGIDATNFKTEKSALYGALQQYGFECLVSVSVGSEDLQRGDLGPHTLAGYINDVRGMLQGMGGYTSEIKVGHVDTENSWDDTANIPVVLACDFIGVDAYPYFQTTSDNAISNAKSVYKTGVQTVKDKIAAAGSDAPVWITETGWPSHGPTKNKAVASVSNAAAYWQDIGCDLLFGTENVFWFTLQDWNAYPTFGIVDGDSNLKYSVDC